MEYKVQFKSWVNNWMEYLEEESYPTLQQAKDRADKMYTFTCTQSTEPGFENNYFNNGVETWVEDYTGHIVYKPNK